MAKSGGTAFPICDLIFPLFPKNTNSSGNPCILAASLDIGTLMDSISVDPNNPIIPSDILQSIQFASDAIGAATTIGEGVLDLGESVYAEAAALVSMFSSLSMSFDILNDPCNKLSVSLGQNIFSPEFVTTVEESNPFVRGGFPN